MTALAPLPPSIPEESPEPSGALVSEDTFYDLDAVVVPRVVEGLEQGADRTRLWIPGAEDEGPDPRVKTGTRAHQAGFQGDEELSPRETVVARSLRSLTERHDLGVCRRVTAAHRLVVASADDFPVPDDDSAHRHFAKALCFAGLLQRLLHGSLEQGRVEMAPQGHGLGGPWLLWGSFMGMLLSSDPCIAIAHNRRRGTLCTLKRRRMRCSDARRWTVKVDFSCSDELLNRGSGRARVLLNAPFGKKGQGQDL